jgi:AraC-like DNA-binding protein
MVGSANRSPLESPMLDAADVGVLLTELSGLTAATPIASLWSYETRSREPARRKVTSNPDGSRQYWLERSDPLLNTILPGTYVSLVVNFGDPWAAGATVTESALVPRISVFGPLTQSRILRVGRCVHAIGAVVAPLSVAAAFGVPPAALVDEIVPLDALWGRADVATLSAMLSDRDPRRSLPVLKDALMARIVCGPTRDILDHTASRIIQAHSGRVSIDALARNCGVSRQLFARRFFDAAGLPPKLFARITRFQKLVHVLLSTDVSEWASVSSAIGFYDQAHMINEFRAFTGSPPTIFFRPHGAGVPPGQVLVRGRPSQWVQRDRGTT